jgi:hypothetical protein
VTSQGDQLARVLGPGWQTMRYSQVADRAPELERAADLALRLARDLVDMHETAGEALGRLEGRVGWPTTSQASPVAGAIGLGDR